MKITNKSIFVLFLVAGVLRTDPAVAAAALQCIDCSAEQMLGMAGTLGPGKRLIWNPTNGEVRRYASYCGGGNRSAAAAAEGSGAIPPGTNEQTCRTLTTEEVPVPAQARQMAHALSRIWLHLGRDFQRRSALSMHLRHYTFAAYPLDPPTARSFLNDFNLHDQIAELVSRPELFQLSDSAIAGPLAYVAAHTDAMRNYVDGVQLDVEVVFADGSKVILHSVLGRRAQHVRQSARDAVTVPTAAARQRRDLRRTTGL